MVGLSEVVLGFDLWEKLNSIKQMESPAYCRKIPPSYEPRKGQAQVTIQKNEKGLITFFEKGKWVERNSKQTIAFTNLFRWSLHKESGEITLQHLRFGKEKPITLVTLAQVEKHLYRSFLPLECKEDTYTATAFFDKHYIHLHWRIIGPKKNEQISVVYF